MKWLERAHDAAFTMFLLVGLVGLIVALVGVLWEASRTTWGF